MHYLALFFRHDHAEYSAHPAVVSPPPSRASTCTAAQKELRLFRWSSVLSMLRDIMLAYSTRKVNTTDSRTPELQSCRASRFFCLTRLLSTPRSVAKQWTSAKWRQRPPQVNSKEQSVIITRLQCSTECQQKPLPVVRALSSCLERKQMLLQL